jgi:hypothetical protein
MSGRATKQKVKKRVILGSNGRQIVLRSHVSKRGKLYWRKRVEPTAPQVEPYTALLRRLKK